MKKKVIVFPGIIDPDQQKKVGTLASCHFSVPLQL